MSSFGKERDRVREVPANGLDHRKASKKQQRDEKPALTGVAPVAVRAGAVPVPMGVIRAVACVVVMSVMLVRVRH